MSEHIEIFKTKKRSSIRFTFRKKSANGQNVGGPNGSYANRSNARRAARRQHPGLRLENK